MQGVLRGLLSTVHGRMRRRTFIFLVTLSYALLFAPFLLAVVAPGLFLLELPALNACLAFANLLALGLVYVGTAFIAAKRLQDMNKPGEVALMTLLPGGFLLLLWIATQPPVDTEMDNGAGGNSYGPNPRMKKAHRGGQQSARREFTSRAEITKPEAGEPI